MNEEEIKISEKDVIEIMDVFTQVPPFMLRLVVSRNSNVVKSFQGQVEDYKNRLSEEGLAKIKKVLEMSVDELQEILKKAYAETHQEQLKILADPKAKPFITKNLAEVKKVLF